MDSVLNHSDLTTREAGSHQPWGSNCTTGTATETCNFALIYYFSLLYPVLVLSPFHRSENWSSEVLYIYIFLGGAQSRSKCQSHKVNLVLFGFKAFAYFFSITALRRPQFCFLTVIPDALEKKPLSSPTPYLPKLQQQYLISFQQFTFTPYGVSWVCLHINHLGIYPNTSSYYYHSTALITNVKIRTKKHKQYFPICWQTLDLQGLDICGLLVSACIVSPCITAYNQVSDHCHNMLYITTTTRCS